MRTLLAITALTIAPMVLIVSCTESPQAPAVDRSTQGGALTVGGNASYAFAPPVFDISAAPDGSVLIAENTTVKEIRKGDIGEVIEIATLPGSAVNGLGIVGRASFFATSAGQDLAVGAGVWHVSHGQARLVADVHAFETANDPDAFEGLEWKVQACEFVPGVFSAGPQSNPYHLTQLTGSVALVADAAGNTVLAASKSGSVDWVAILSPPTADGSGSDDPQDWLVQFPLNAETDCYVQPVPTSVAIGPDDAYYVGELVGLTAENFSGVASPGLSRIWRISPGARHVVCPSADCQVILSGLTSVIDLAFGPDGMLYVLEYDENGWALATDALGMGLDAAGGTLNRCNVSTGTCLPIAEDLVLPGAISFDERGGMWLLENNIGIPAFALGLSGPSVPTVYRMN